MPPPEPLTRTPPPRLDFSRPGTPAATDFDDIYFSTDGGLAETEAVFLEGCDLPERWQDRDMFTIAELGFGSGLNFLATCKAWAESGAKGRLHFISVEGFPFERDDLAKALNAFPELSTWAAPLIQSWPGPVKGLHRRHFGPITLTLVHDAVNPALAAQDFRADAWFLDGFSPAKNPDMWSDHVMAEVARLSMPDARLATFTVAGHVRRALQSVGFEVNRKPGFGRKRHRLEARRTGTHPVPPKVGSPTIIGDGIAGASIVRAFRRRGITPRVIYDPDHIAASGNGVALIKPRLDLQDHPTSRFFLSSFLYARQVYENATRHKGLIHLPKSDQERTRFARLADHEPLGPGHLDWTNDALNMPTSIVIDTETARMEFLGSIEPEPLRLNDLSEIDGPIILACGYGIRTLLPDSGFRFSRGQLSWTDGTLNTPVTYGGYAIPVRDRILLGATHDRIDDHVSTFVLRPEDDQHNLEMAIAQGINVGPNTESFRASVRVNSADTLPRLFKISPSGNAKAKTRPVWGLSGLGSRGFVFAPLLGEALVSDYLGEPSPLERMVRGKFSDFPHPDHPLRTSGR